MNEMESLLSIGKTRKIVYELDKGNEDLNDFIGKCLIGDPTKRATVNQLLQHDFLRV